MDLIDLHQNTEWPARLDQVLSSSPVDWADRRENVQAAAPPGLARLQLSESARHADSTRGPDIA